MPLTDSAFLRGSMSGMLVVSILQPLDVVKTIQQGNSKSLSIRDALVQVVREDGAKGLWLRGLSPSLVRGALGPGTYFQAIELTNGWFEHSKAWDFVQGATARGVGAVVVSPFSVLKARLEWNARSPVRFSSARDMFVGLAPTLARDLPFSGLYVVFYRLLKDQANGGASGDLMAGLTAGLLSTFLTHPFDVLKTRAQIGTTAASSNGGELWSGLALRLVKRPLSTAFTWAFYEAFTRLSTATRE